MHQEMHCTEPNLNLNVRARLQQIPNFLFVGLLQKKPLDACMMHILLLMERLSHLIRAPAKISACLHLCSAADQTRSR